MLSKDDSPSVAVERALAMLEAVAQEPEGLSNAEISRKLQIPKSSASYILRTLETQGYLNRDESTGKYRVGLKILSLSRGALSGIDVREVALPIMRHLVEKTSLTCHLAILDGPEAVYIEKVEPPAIKGQCYCILLTRRIAGARPFQCRQPRVHPESPGGR